jgi:methylthioribulose-1-phosphate dehydratase
MLSAMRCDDLSLPPGSVAGMTDFEAATASIIAVGRRLERRGLAPATAGNYSMHLADGTIAITVSGAHKGRLSTNQVMRVSPAGVALDDKPPSAETPLHCLIYSVDPRARAVLHTHSVAGTVLSRALAGHSSIHLQGYEMLKVFPSVTDHGVSVAVPLFDNCQDITALAGRLRPTLKAREPPLPAFYIRGHGLYAWGPTMQAAENIVEGSEFLIACAWAEWTGGSR